MDIFGTFEFEIARWYFGFISEPKSKLTVGRWILKNSVWGRLF